MASNPAQGPGGLQGLAARWNDLTQAWRLNVVLYSLTVLSLVALVFELVAGDDTAPKVGLTSQAAIATSTTRPAAVAATTTAPTSTSTTSSTVAPATTIPNVVRTTVPVEDTEPEPEPEPEPEETTTVPEETTTVPDTTLPEETTTTTPSDTTSSTTA